MERTMNEKKAVSLALLELNNKVKNQDLASASILPVWRRLWLDIKCNGGEMDFIQENSSVMIEVALKLANLKYDIILIHIDSFIPNWLFPFIKLLHNTDQSIDIFLCGFIPTVKCGELAEALPEVHAVISGPLESSMEIIYNRIGITFRPYEVKDISAVDQSVFKDLFLKDSVGLIQASAGCPMTCSFCRYSSLYHRYYKGVYEQFPIDNIVSEILELNRKFNISHFKFIDSNFLGCGKMAYKRAVDLASSLQAKGLDITCEMHCRSDMVQTDIISQLVKCGLRHLSIGIESMSQNQLDRFGKKETVMDHRSAKELTVKHGISVQGYAILADPLVTREELLENLSGLYELSEEVLFIINEKMILYSTTDYYKKYHSLLSGLKPFKVSLGTAFDYSFKDKWCIENFGIFQKASLLLKYKIRTLPLSYSPFVSFADNYLYIKKATSHKIQLLMRIVSENKPDESKVMLWCNEALKKIEELLTSYNELKVIK